MRLSLPILGAAAPRYLIALGDTLHTPEPRPGLRIIPLARPDATIAAVRYVQIPQWKEMGVKAAHIQLSIGYADLMATLGDETFAATAYLRFTEHAQVIAAELEVLCEPGAEISIVALMGFEGWNWRERFQAALSGIIRP